MPLRFDALPPCHAFYTRMLLHAAADYAAIDTLRFDAIYADILIFRAPIFFAIFIRICRRPPFDVIH